MTVVPSIWMLLSRRSRASSVGERVQMSHRCPVWPWVSHFMVREFTCIPALLSVALAFFTFAS